jgi:hypothetical protein
MIFPATMPELARTKRDDVLRQAAERGRTAQLRGWPRRPAPRARLASTVTRFAVRLDHEASRRTLGPALQHTAASR